jgi:hypothetical protein
MAEMMSHVERVLWRIAELGARCSQQAAAGGRGPLWAELEETIAGLQAEFESASQAVDIAPEQVRVLEGRLETLEGRLKVAQQERDREKSRNREHIADAEAARRERDRALQKARKAIALTTEAKAAALEARSTAAECVARASAAENSAKKAMAARTQALAERDQAVASRDEAVNALAEALAARDKVEKALAAALTTGERAADARDEAVTSRDNALLALGVAQARITELEAALEAARDGRDDAVDTMAARAEGAVVVLPGMTIPEPVGPIAPPSKVSWQPTWSEWARPDAGEPDFTDFADVTDVRDVVDVVGGATEIHLDDSPAEEDEVRGYLNVAATIGQLLPADLSPLLVSGATVVRREGRLFVTVAVPGADTAQAARFTDAGFKAEWASHAPLGV